jgi:ubiquinone/menaquinone biosynthesis C-methylase UbiE
MKKLKLSLPVPRVRIENVDLLCQQIEKDEFDDSLQNKQVFSKKDLRDQGFLVFIFEHYLEEPVLDLACGGSGFLPKIFPSVTHGVDPHPDRVDRARASSAYKNVKQGYMEAIPFSDESFEGVICLGSFGYARSEQEALMEMNRVLTVGGNLCLDIVLETTMPIAKTWNERGFCKFLELFGFDIKLRVPFGTSYYKKVCVVAEKFENFNPKRLLLPQVEGGDIHNFFTERDWYLR